MLPAYELEKKQMKTKKNPGLHKKTLSKSLVMLRKLLLNIRLYEATANFSFRKEKAF